MTPNELADELERLAGEATPYSTSDALTTALVNNLPAIIAALREVDELNRVFDMKWEADRRATKRWQEAHPGNDNVWPDRADMVVWLMDQHEAALRQPRMDEETVERVARAIYETVPENYRFSWDRLTDLTRETYRREARAAIKAMFEK